ncbi:nuclear transport factor 2 family protein [Psychroserpens algicola]|uniref:Nuclear transport factor 2 family protein n=1 Tax=Psychroserpens algicola TaxID=1719034 RepID=A0ABT0H9S4_9FLAO|nr:nuclear transport factor 2 family protein [Psychroserpens algicola]MCK8481129.1 nuclear transport factor 2 family protein [Psychroserpens algicola]
MKLITKTLLLLSVFICLSCKKDIKHKTSKDTSDYKTEFVAVLQKHLDAVSQKDLSTLETTLSPSGKMQLILPQTEVTNTVKEFVEYHREWFKDTTWSFKTKIKDTTIQPAMGIAIVEIVYSEPERDGKPYFNRMTISYALEKQNGIWYVIKDHASSIEKSTD